MPATPTCPSLVADKTLFNLKYYCTKRINKLSNQLRIALLMKFACELKD